MDYGLTEEQEMLRKSARDFLTGVCSESFVRDMEKDPKGYSPELWRKIAQLGWLGIAFPSEYGGADGNFIDLAVLYGEFGRSMFPSPHLSTAVLCGLTILSAGTDKQKSDLLPRIAKGDLVMALALTEASARWDARGVAVKAVAEGDSYVINGTKLFVHDAHVADYLLVAVRTRQSAKPENGVTLFLVDARTRGITCNLLKATGGDHQQSEVIFDKVKVPKANMVGKLNGGWAPLEKSVQVGAVMLCAQMSGANQRLLEMTLDYAKTRVQFDEPIGINQYVQQFCVDLLACTDTSWWVTNQAAWKLSRNEPAEMEVAVAKAWASESSEEAGWNAHQVFAGVGYTTEMGWPPLLSRRGKMAQLYLGDAAFYREKVVQQLEKWVLEAPKGKPMGIFERDQVMAWKRQAGK